MAMLFLLYNENVVNVEVHVNPVLSAMWLGREILEIGLEKV